MTTGVTDARQCVVFTQHCHIEPAVAHFGFESRIKVVGPTRYTETGFVNHSSQQVVREVFFVVQFRLGMNGVTGCNEVFGPPIDIGNHMGF